MNIRDITFDEDDKTLFLIDDLQLKADAIRYSILPKLYIVVSETISRIIEIYELDFYENYSVTKSPHFRTGKNQRKEPTKHNYTRAGISINGQRKANKWLGLKRKEGKDAVISPTCFGIGLFPSGLNAYFIFNHPKNFSEETYKMFYNFFLENTEIIAGLLLKSGFKHRFNYIDSMTLFQDLTYKLEEKNYDLNFLQTSLNIL